MTTRDDWPTILTRAVNEAQANDPDTHWTDDNVNQELDRVSDTDDHGTWVLATRILSEARA